MLAPLGACIADRWLVYREVFGARREGGFIEEPDSPCASQRPERTTGPRLGGVTEGGLPVRFLPPGGGSQRGLARMIRKRARCLTIGKAFGSCRGRISNSRRCCLSRLPAVGEFARPNLRGSLPWGGRVAHRGSEASCCGHTLQWCPRLWSRIGRRQSFDSASGLEDPMVVRGTCKSSAAEGMRQTNMALRLARLSPVPGEPQERI